MMEEQIQNDPIKNHQPQEIALSAIVLAGGRSSRMGRDKALIVVNDRPLLVQVCEVARECADLVYVVTPWIDRYQALLNDAVQFVPEHLLPNNITPHGPLVGFAQGLAQVNSEWVLLLACDLPHLQVKVLQQWSHLLPIADAKTIALLPRNPQGWWEALCGFYRTQCLESLEPFIAQGGRSFQRWLSQQEVQELPVPDRQMLMNCNTPADLDRL